MESANVSCSVLLVHEIPAAVNALAALVFGVFFSEVFLHFLLRICVKRAPINFALFLEVLLF